MRRGKLAAEFERVNLRPSLVPRQEIMNRVQDAQALIIAREGSCKSE